MAWVLIFVQATLGLVDGYVFMPSKNPTHRLVSNFLIDIPSMLLMVYSVGPYGLTMTMLQVVAAYAARVIVWHSYGQEKYNRVLEP